MAIANASSKAKTVADPIAEFESLHPAWKRSRAMCSGEGFVKAYDSILDTFTFTNLLIPFSPSMTPQQYNFYKAEAELPGITAEFAKMLLGGLLRKEPTIELPSNLPKGALEWIKGSFSQDNSSISTFLDESIWEELQTSRAWVYVDYPKINNADELTPDQRKEIKPYPIIWKAEEVINWTTGSDDTGKVILTRLITRGMEEVFRDDNEFHSELIDTVRVYELDKAGKFQIRLFRASAPSNTAVVVDGQRQESRTTKQTFILEQTISDILMNGERLSFIPAWPLNGQIKPVMPMLDAIINKEISLYNKMSRRNHLLYGAATYTPVIFSDMAPEKFDAIVMKGLGSWLLLDQEARAEVLATPTDALKDMDRAIAANIEEMAKLGIRMLSPESGDQSGIALELRNAAQTARLGSLANKISRTMEDIIAFMLEWRYGVEIDYEQIVFKLSEDFNPTPLGADWLRLATEWYETGKIPRSVWLQILKVNDMVPPDYDDEKGKVEITEDMETALKLQEKMGFADDLRKQGESNG